MGLRDRTMEVRAGLDVQRARVGARLREVGELALGPFDHQVHVEHAADGVDLVRDRGDDARPERDRRDEVPVHHVAVEGSRPGVEQLAHLCAERAEVRREDRRQHELVFRPGHARSLGCPR